MSKKEEILVIPAAEIKKLNIKQGVDTNNEKIEKILGSANLSFKDRATMEEDPSYKQLIPYCIFIHENKIFSYQRTPKGGENRLHNKYSIGVGGHINPVDSLGSDDNVYLNGMLREIEEEVGKLDYAEHHTMGMINDDSNPVGAVHIGVVEVFKLKESKLNTKDEALSNGVFIELSEIIKNKDNYENWSKIIIDFIDNTQDGD